MQIHLAIQKHSQTAEEFIVEVHREKFEWEVLSSGTR